MGAGMYLLYIGGRHSERIELDGKPHQGLPLLAVCLVRACLVWCPSEPRWV
jgi:hypothetical protein